MTPLRKLQELIQAEFRHPVPAHVGRWHLVGGWLLFLVALQILSGILLMIYYRPSPDEAYESVRYVMNDVRLGWLVRGMHYWGAHLLIVVLLLHLVRVYFFTAYRERELNWAIGLLLFLGVGAFAFTGMLLPWDQQAYWNADAVRNALEHVPMVGKIILELLWGGHELETGALLRFYIFHVGLLPWLLGMLIAAHLYLVNRQGLYTPSPFQGEGQGEGQSPASSRTYYDMLLEGLFLALVTFGGLLTLAVLFTPTLGESIDLLRPSPVQVSWYFWPVVGLFRLVSVELGVWLVGLGFVGLFLVPLLRVRWMALGLGALAVLGVLVLTVLGYLTQGGPR
ncbi:MAG: cytochrome b N-terminal domain-containing protein [Candidatus Bipolaricaulota bacterium]|nr:cytochrome b N-terminal domain-containing protein [Candidatus Bipolaricaulota bacterium]MCS7274999.1 cytochrome b N-terminal domain-containing protein [Candidatus Bipolaricaulota bacterium]MDW8110536.1 cytochrome b N-terminal domain-containing protein [Candidatus Bipolaricaulota bacterium]MDW8329313.1 cytochrome b N-terminal domain-containing protein [Candidatus Bipolaricaulota bacterium]